MEQPVTPPPRGVLPLAQQAIDTLCTSRALLLQLPTVRRLALTETIRAAKSDESVRHVIFGNLSTSPYFSEEQKAELSRLAREWSEYTPLAPGGAVQQNDAIIAGFQAALQCDRRDLDLLVNKPPLSADEAFTQFREMVALLFRRSRKLWALPPDIRRELGRNIHEATSREQLVQIALAGLEGGHAFPTAEGRERVTQDILDERYDLLLLPDRLDCIPAPAAARPPSLRPAWLYSLARALDPSAGGDGRILRRRWRRGGGGGVPHLPRREPRLRGAAVQASALPGLPRAVGGAVRGPQVLPMPAVPRPRSHRCRFHAKSSKLDDEDGDSGGGGDDGDREPFRTTRGRVAWLLRCMASGSAAGHNASALVERNRERRRRSSGHGRQLDPHDRTRR